MTSLEQNEEITASTYNNYTDFWRYDINVNVILADTQNKRLLVEWPGLQDNSEEQYNKWKSEDISAKGMAVILDKYWIQCLEPKYDMNNKKRLRNGKVTQPANYTLNQPTSSHQDQQQEIVSPV